MFGTIKQGFDKHVVIPDLHGEFALLSRVVEQYYDDESIGFVGLGDVIDRRGPNLDRENGVKRTIEIIRQLGDRAIMTLANHEWYLLGSVLCRDAVRRGAIEQSWIEKRSGGSSSVEQNTFSSYGLRNNGISTASDLWDEMDVHGHAGVLTQATPYYETDDFIAVHAGLEYGKPWEDQRVELEVAAALMSSGIFDATPAQWFDTTLAVDITDNTATKKTIVSGHAHYLDPSKKYKTKKATTTSDQRVLHNGRRVRLASKINSPVNAPLFIWQDWDGEVKKIEQE